MNLSHCHSHVLTRTVHGYNPIPRVARSRHRSANCGSGRLDLWSRWISTGPEGHCSGVYLEQGISLDRKKFEMYLRLNGARSTKLLGENVIYIHFAQNTTSAMAARRLLAIPVPSGLQPLLYACPLFAAVLQSFNAMLTGNGEPFL
jgi:hypothetical protein